jgi:hypothetical protein
MKDLHRRVAELLGQVTSDRMQRAYEHRVKRLNQGTTTDGDYV